MSPYVVLDGPDGCGKSVQAERLAEWLGRRGKRTVHLREPGSTPVGEAIRRLLLDPGSGDLRPLTEALLFFAARAELVHRQISPELAAGTVVIVERCYLSTLVYQGLANDDDGVDPGLLRSLVAAAHGPVMPHRIFLLDVPAEVAAERRGRRRADRIEDRDRDFHERVRQGYLALAPQDDRVAVVDASRSFDEVQAELRAGIGSLLAEAPP